MYAVAPLTPSGAVYAGFKSKCHGKTEGASRNYTTEKCKKRRISYTDTNKNNISLLFQEGSVGGFRSSPFVW